ncbi:uncharacterized protein LOC105628425 isoform X2 [Jatropha curcas]|uniref:uncharacterized protein LOC105628425 isoform X2 n=1 Tax=Jatropha curcas TaxID=180498 RepID=UPI0005FBB0E5|nr:uncharacterized protein LOC105628425 isoform X2 [Jatropha curcas]
MAALAASVPQWIPEDDLLLKNAVEAGASLEALAKGAVRFSRKFTVGELRDRWHSLLYDPIISAEASARMMEVELSVTNSRVSVAEVSVKRKLETVRQMYYATRKKICSRSAKCPNFSFLDAPDNGIAFHSPVGDGNCVFGDSNQNQLEGNLSGMEANGVDILNCSPAISKCDYADLSEALLNFSNEDDLLLVDADGQHAVDNKSCFDDGISMSFWDNDHGSAQDVKEPNTLFSDVKESNTLFSDESLEIPEGPRFCSEMNLPSSVLAESTLSMKHSDVELECILNSEDPEIPCNDHVFFPRKDKQGQRLVKKQENPLPSLISTRVSVLNIWPGTSSGHQPVGCRVKCESPRDAASREANGDSNQCSVNQAARISTKVELLNSETLHACNFMDLPVYATTCSPEQVTSVTESDTLMVNEEESEIEDDFPSYSDIEAMILEMDLFPDDIDSHISSEVSRYQNEDSVRKIIRLEQCAQSSMQRTIASRGALAVLYGRHLKHYIRETEVC